MVNRVVSSEGQQTRQQEEKAKQNSLLNVNQDPEVLSFGGSPGKNPEEIAKTCN
jgi:organic hydroperoxide reductase OsmC/OhrA